MSVLREVTKELKAIKCEGWQRALALSLAKAMDESPSASTAKELKLLMGELGSERKVETGDVADELAAKRAERRRAAGS